jgi:hypothetical protein
MKIKNDLALNSMLTREYRDGWKIV